MAGSGSIQQRALRVAVVGCGQIARIFHIPLLASRRDCDIVALIDADLDRARALARPFGIPHMLASHDELPGGDVDLAVVATPNHTHAPIAEDLLRAGIHVLVEKPMARTLDEAHRMQLAAEAGGVQLSVAAPLRFGSAVAWLSSCLESGMLGELRDVEIRYGFILDWPKTSPSALRKEMSGGGTLIDIGPHVFDLLALWFGEITVSSYQDDDFGGVEANCLISFSVPSGAPGVIELSRNRRLGQKVRATGTRAATEIDLWRNVCLFHTHGQSYALQGRALPRDQVTDESAGDHNLKALVRLMHDDVLQAVRSSTPSSVNGANGIRVMEIIERCYADRTPLELPWVVPVECATTLSAR